MVRVRDALLAFARQTNYFSMQSWRAQMELQKLREIFRFEFTYQARQMRTWLYFGVLSVVAYLVMANSIDDARNGGALANSPFSIALATVICSLLWVLIGTGVAGSAAARDV